MQRQNTFVHTKCDRHAVGETLREKACSVWNEWSVMHTLLLEIQQQLFWSICHCFLTQGKIINVRSSSCEPKRNLLFANVLPIFSHLPSSGRNDW